MGAVVTALFGSAAFALCVLLAKAVRDARARNWISAEFVLAAIATLAASAGGLATAYSGGKTEILTSDGLVANVAFSPVSTLVQQFAIGAVILAAAGYIVVRLARGVVINGAALWYLGAVVVGTLAGAAQGMSLVTPQRLALIVVLGACALAPRGHDAVRGASVVLAGLVIASFALVLVHPEVAYIECGAVDRKCSAFGVLFNGTTGSFNGHGILLSVAIPVLYFGLTRYGLTFAVAAFVQIVATESRTALLAGTVALLLIVSHRIGTRRGSRIWAPVAVGAALASLAAMAYLPFAGVTDAQLTNRPGLWAYALKAVESHMISGLGPEKWATYRDIGVVTRASEYSTHNQFVETLFVSGVLGLVAVSAALLTLVRSNRANVGQFSILLAPVLLAGIAERPWSLGPLDWMAWSIVVVVMTQFEPVETSPDRPARGTTVHGTSGRRGMRARRLSGPRRPARSLGHSQLAAPEALPGYDG